jgi:hypothetical protein
MELVDILVLGTSAERRAGSNPAGGILFESYIIFTLLINTVFFRLFLNITSVFIIFIFARWQR